jgi:hypothetical protein
MSEKSYQKEKHFWIQLYLEFLLLCLSCFQQTRETGQGLENCDAFRIDLKVRFQKKCLKDLLGLYSEIFFCCLEVLCSQIRKKIHLLPKVE